jgi:polyhydroxyalkanoate synthase subunit PhaC
MTAIATTLRDRIGRDLERSASRARNGLGLIAGTRRSGVGMSPKRAVWRSGRAALYRYEGRRDAGLPPIVLVFSLVCRPYVLDLRPGHSFVEFLVDKGHDVYMVDWGVPEEADSENSLETYTLHYLPQIIEAARERSRAEQVNLLGYCLGGLLSVLALSAQPLPVNAFVSLATPIGLADMPVIANIVRTGLDVHNFIDETGNVPAEVIADAISMLKPTAAVVNYANLWQNLWNDEFVDAYQSFSGWSREHVPFPGRAFQQMSAFMTADALTTNSVVLDERDIDLGSVACPILCVLGSDDHLVPLSAAEGLEHVVGSKQFDELRVDTGHMGLMVGRKASTTVFPCIAEWLEKH